MKFTKMHGIGNDYVYVNCFKETVKDPSAVAKFVSDRHFGIGSDGLILIKPSDIADCEMDMYNLDGSQGAMCGNGIRCVAKYAYDYGIVNKTSISVATKSGVKYLDLSIRDGKVSMVKVNMGAPILQASLIPVVSEDEQVIDADAGLVYNAVIVGIFGNAADSVSAHGTLGTIQVIHIHFTVCNVRGLDQDQPVRANAEMAVTYKLRHR